MRIVFVISGLAYGGAESQVLALSRELTRRGHSVAVFTLNSDNPRSQELDGSGVNLVVDQKSCRLDLVLLWRLRKFVSAFKADVVHGFLYDGDFYSRVAAAGLGIPVLNSERNDAYVLNRAQRLGHVITRKLASGVVANSHAGARFAERLFRVSSDNVHVVWNGLNLAAFDKRVASSVLDYKRHFFGVSDMRLACLVGAIKPQKDFLLALDCAAELVCARPEWRVLFVGDQLSNTGDYKRLVLERFEALGLRERVVFSGLRTDVPEILRRCDVLFSTSLHEGFPNVVLEAMAARVPVVTTEFSDIRRILPCDWQVSRDRSAGALVSLIERAYAERETLVQLQRDWIERNATIEASAATLESVYAMYVPSRIALARASNSGDANCA